jgi:flagellin
MSLGVLNNLSAMYAESNLNNTQNSLTKTLQQLSSGSKINSGADDAAGLSLVNGLAANANALAQSQTNAQEGVGLLQVADGALSQVTNLLNRAVTLATEASNGTLNASQDQAANQEYQSILAEINNIGSTTTYNQQQVFNSSTNIYVGDSSTQGASVNSISISGLSSSNIGDSGGMMSYSSGQNNVFLNLSTSSANAALTDTLNSSGATTINVNYRVPGANGGSSIASTQISVGGTTSYANTTSGLISAINNAGLGFTASFATQAQAGVQGGGSETGIMITGGLVSVGSTPGTASTSGTLDLNGLAPGATLALGATVTINQGSNSHLFTIDQNSNTLSTLRDAINGQSSLGVTASVITNGDGTQSLSLADTSSTGGALSVTTTNSTTQAPAFAAGTTGTSVAVQTQGTQVAGSQYVASRASSVVVGASGTNDGTDTLTLGSSITVRNTIPNNQQDLTFVIGEGTNVVGAHASTIYTGSAAGADTLAGLAASINAQNGTLGVYATVGSTGLTLTTGTWDAGTSTGTPTTLTGENVSVQSNNLTSSTTATQLSAYTPQIAGQTTVAGTSAVTVLDNGVAAAAAGDTLTGSITLTNSSGSYTFTAGAGTDTANTFFLGNYGGSTYTGLVAAITAKTATLGYGAAWDANAGGLGTGGVVLTGNGHGINPITVGTNSLANSTHPGAIGADAGGTGVTDGTDNVVATSSTAILQLASGNIDDAHAVLGGALSLTFNGHSQVFIMGDAPSDVNTLVGGAIYTGDTTVASLVDAINSAGTLGLTASAPTGGTGGIYLQGGSGIAQPITMNSVTANLMTPLAVTAGLSQGSAVTAVTGVVGNNAVDNLTATNNLGAANTVNTNDVMSGGLWVVNGATTDKFIIGRAQTRQLRARSTPTTQTMAARTMATRSPAWLR